MTVWKNIPVIASTFRKKHGESSNMRDRLGSKDNNNLSLGLGVIQDEYNRRNSVNFGR